MNKKMLKLIEDALRKDQALFPLNQSWQYLHREFNIGRIAGNRLELNLQDKDELKALAQSIGIDFDQASMSDLNAMNREEALSFSIDEKMAGLSVKKDRLAMKVCASVEAQLKLNGQSYCLPNRGHLDIALSDIENIGHRCILLIENYRCFDRLEKMILNLAEPYDDPLVLFRGDNEYSQGSVRQLLQRFELPVMVMADIDPQGLVIAQSFPNLIGLISPGLTELEGLFKQKGNPKLYEKQLPGCQNVLSNSPHALIRTLWNMMKKYQSGIVQEYWLQGNYELLLHGLNKGLDQ